MPAHWAISYTFTKPKSSGYKTPQNRLTTWPLTILSSLLWDLCMSQPWVNFKPFYDAISKFSLSDFQHIEVISFVISFCCTAVCILHLIWNKNFKEKSNTWRESGFLKQIYSFMELRTARRCLPHPTPVPSLCNEIIYSSIRNIIWVTGLLSYCTISGSFSSYFLLYSGFGPFWTLFPQQFAGQDS